jgi:hypothetical protein
MKTWLNLILLCSAVTQAQDRQFILHPGTETFSDEVRGAIGRSFTIRDYTVGNLNNDGLDDIVVIAEPENTEASRSVLLFINRGNNTFVIQGTNNTIVDCIACGGGGVGDPYQQTVIKNGYFSIELLYGANTKDAFTITFKHDKNSGNWLLHKYTQTTYNSTDPGNATTTEPEKDLYGKVTFEEY